MLLISELLFIVLLSMILFMLYTNERAIARRLVPQAKAEEYWAGKERRQCVRFKKDLEVKYLVEKKPHLKNYGKAADISNSGVKLLLDEKLAVGTILDLAITLPDLDKTIEVEGEVVWIEEAGIDGAASGKRRFHAGVRFLAVKGSSGAELTSYIRSACTDLCD